MMMMMMMIIIIINKKIKERERERNLLPPTIMVEYTNSDENLKFHNQALTSHLIHAASLVLRTNCSPKHY